MDFSKLDWPEPNSYSELSFKEIMPLYDYHKWYIYPNGIRQENPKINHITNLILNLKNEDKQKARQYAVSHFSEKISSIFLPLLDSTDVYFSLVPPHKKNGRSLGLLELVSALNAKFNFKNRSNFLNRTQTIEKVSQGGSRKKAIHLESIEVIRDVELQSKSILLFDDVSSTGNSINVCREILLNAGAKSVAMITLGQTI